MTTQRAGQEATDLEAAPPRIVTTEEYRATWEPQGWQLLVVGPTATWRQEWGEWEAIRDIVQNALDETESYSWGYDDHGLYISDEGKGVAVADFLLGPPKLKPSHARGKFGEGMKIAALALLRMNYSVRVETVGREIWMVFLGVEVDGRVDQLAALWRSNGRRRGTEFHIVGYTGTAFEDRFAVNIPFKNILHEGPSPLHEPIQRYNQLIAKPAGRIYGRDIYMRDINSPFSYNLWGFEMAPDRHGPKSDYEVWVDVGRLWATVTNVKLLERFLRMVIDPPLERADENIHAVMDRFQMGKDPVSEQNYLGYMEDNSDIWQDAWKQTAGENHLLRTDERWDGTVRHLGYESTSVVYSVRDTLSHVLKTDAVLVSESQESLSGVKIIPDEMLSERQLNHLKLARVIAVRFGHPEITEVHAAIIPPASDRLRTAGLYQSSNMSIYIASDQLERGRWTVDTTIHEVAHHTSGAEDGEPAHNKELSQVGARVVELVTSGFFDDVLKQVHW